MLSEVEREKMETSLISVTLPPAWMAADPEECKEIEWREEK